MTDELTPRLKAPLMTAGQAQKHVTHNEAIMVLDALAQLSVVSSTSTPPSSPVADCVYIIGASPSGVWAGKATQIARYQDGAWAYSVPQNGWRAWVQDVAQMYVFTGSAWVNYNSLALNNVPMLGVNTTANSTTKFISKSDANLFDQVTGSARVNVNKAATGDTASFIFQKNFSGRAEFGLMGVDNFGVKVSADGTSWKQALSVDSAGCVSFPSGVMVPSGRNFVINGGFDIWQRGTSFSIAAGTYTTFTADRWLGFADSGIISTISRQTFAPGSAPVAGYEGQYYLRCAGTVAVSGGAYGIEQRIEDVRTFAGKTVTISFWAKANTAVTGYLLFNQRFGSGGSAEVGIPTNTFAFTTSWQRFTQTIAVPSITGKAIGVNSHIAVHPLRLVASATVDIWGIQIEDNGFVTAFDVRPAAQELVLCQRYFQTTYDGVAAGSTGVSGELASYFPATIGAGGYLNFTLTFPVTMRTAPTVISYNPSTGASGAASINGVNTAWAINATKRHIGSMQNLSGSSTPSAFNINLHYSANAEL